MKRNLGEKQEESGAASPSHPRGRLIPDVKAPSAQLRTLFANRFAQTDFSIVSGRRNARPDRTPYGMLIHAVQILFLRDLNSANEKTITRTLCRCLRSDSTDSPFLPTLRPFRPPLSPLFLRLLCPSPPLQPSFASPYQEGVLDLATRLRDRGDRRIRRIPGCLETNRTSQQKRDHGRLTSSKFVAITRYTLLSINYLVLSTSIV